MKVENSPVVGQINSLNCSKIFSQAEAEGLKGILSRISTRTQSELNALNGRANHVKNDRLKHQEVLEDINQVMKRWSDHVRRLGGIPVSLFAVRIPQKHSDEIWRLKGLDTDSRLS